MALSYDIAIIGGGPAGSAAAITAARQGASVLLLDKDRFPREKVCGEFVSAESLNVLSGLLPNDLLVLERAPRIHVAQFHFCGGQCLTTNIDPHALSIPRYELDSALWTAAKTAGVGTRDGTTVMAVTGPVPFTIETRSNETFRANLVINASGRWSELSQEKDLTDPKWIGMKAHFRGDVASEAVHLYFFRGGYCGVQPVGHGKVNVSAVLRGGVARAWDDVFRLSPKLADASRSWTQATETVFTAPLFFREPQPTRDGILQIGDAASFIDPFLGDGISMALQSGVMAAKACSQQRTAPQACEVYSREYAQRLSPAFRNASWLRRVIGEDGGLNSAALLAAKIPGVLPLLLRSTRARGA